MNLQVSLVKISSIELVLTLRKLANTEEYQDGKSNGALGEVFIRQVYYNKCIGICLWNIIQMQ